MSAPVLQVESLTGLLAFGCVNAADRLYKHLQTGFIQVLSAQIGQQGFGRHG